MRLIDAEQCPCNDCVPPLGDSRGCSIFPCREFGEWYETTAYDVDKVVMDLENTSYCKYTPTFDNPYTDSIIDLDEAIDIVKRGGKGVNNGYT